MPEIINGLPVTPADHIAQAVELAGVVTHALGKDVLPEGAALNMQGCEVYLHAAEVHLKLADAKRRHVSDVAYQPDYG
jgi:hypothetical protein